MIIAIDANCLVRWSNPSEHPDDAERLDLLLTTVSKAGGKLVIPMPAFAEYLVGTGEATAAWISSIERKKSVVLAPLDRRAAYECALIDRAAFGSGDKRSGRVDPWQKIKIDRQIIAIARVNQVTLIVSNDTGVVNTALNVGLQAKSISELPASDGSKQQKLDLPPPT